MLEGAVEVSPCGGNQPVTEPSGKAVRVAPDCKSSSVSLDSVTTDVTTSTDYDVAENGGGTSPDGGGTSNSPNNSDGAWCARAMAAASLAVAATVAVVVTGETAAADSAAAAAIPTISLARFSHDPLLLLHLRPAIGRDIAGDGLGEFLRPGGAEMPLVDEIGNLPFHR